MLEMKLNRDEEKMPSKTTLKEEKKLSNTTLKEEEMEEKINKLYDIHLRNEVENLNNYENYFTNIYNISQELKRISTNTNPKYVELLSISNEFSKKILSGTIEENNNYSYYSLASCEKKMFNFKQEFKKHIATNYEIEENQIIILNVRKGSIIVSFIALGLLPKVAIIVAGLATIALITCLVIVLVKRVNRNKVDDDKSKGFDDDKSKGSKTDIQESYTFFKHTKVTKQNDASGNETTHTQITDRCINF